MSLLDVVPQPLLDDILAYRCLPIIDSGFSRNAKSPEGMMPNWNEVGNHFAKKLARQNRSYISPLDSISIYTHEYSRASTIENLKSIFHIDTVSLGEVHKAFARLPFDTIITTNYDDLLEKSYKNMGRKYIVIADENQFSTARINFATHDATLILKIHGDFEHPDKMVITEDDFDQYREENQLMTTCLTSLMMVKTVLFIGYSLDDPNIRPLLYVIYSRFKKLRRQAYSFSNARRSSNTSKKFEMRGIREIHIGNELRWSKMFLALYDYWQNNLSILPLK